MIEKIMYWKVCVFAGLALLLSFADMVLVKGNQDLQAQVGQQQAIINTAVRVEPLNKQLSQALFNAFTQDGDMKIRDLLVTQGFVLPEQPPAPIAQPSQQEEPKKEEK